MHAFIKKMRGAGKCPPRAPFRAIIIAWLGGVFAISAVAYLANITHFSLILASFGASCVLIFGFPDSPLSQPRNVIGGHFLASLTGLIFLALFGAHWWSMSLAVGTTIAVMLLTRTAHAPAGSNPLIVMLSAPTWDFLLTPTLIGSIVIVIVALIFNNLPKDRHYPTYWI